ncbi:hypothetical protein CVT24_001721 [Panaeolus cyanescens]|uniref:Vacuolar protein sorting-associated protein 41 n=1 Tax=Panaeolus cyanescens TaxID=181874 RepID=A0A409YUC2_9AGAR|nr:hypothetical protein CVT24_001721 [Panaeolus cyanescens]
MASIEGRSGNSETGPISSNGNNPHTEKDDGVPVRMSESPTPMSDSEEEEEEDGDDSSSQSTAEGDNEAQNGSAHPAGIQDDDVEQDDEEDDEDEEDEDEDEEEPSLKYERITGAIPDLLRKDSASGVAVTTKLLAMGTHAGIVHVMDLTGKRLKSYKKHVASIIDISFDATSDFVATASIDGQVVVHSLSTQESYSFDMKRPMRTVAMEPNFAKRSTRAFVCGGLSGALVLREKGWLGHKETTIHSGEGPIWQVRWRGNVIAWANDLGVKLYDVNSQTRIAYIDRPADSPRADLFKCTLHWQDDSTLLIAWANFIKVVRLRARQSPTSNQSPLQVEVTAVFQLDCMIAGIVPHPSPAPPPSSALDTLPKLEGSKRPKQAPLTSFLIVAYSPPEAFDDADEMTEDRARQARKAAERPELRIVSRAGEELAADALSITDFQHWGCNDYVLADVGGADDPLMQDADRSYVVLSPRDLVRVRMRDKRDHVAWLVERRRYEEALSEVEKLEEEEGVKGGPVASQITQTVDESTAEKQTLHLTSQQIGQKFIAHLVHEGDFIKAASLCPKVCGKDAKRWEKWIFEFAGKNQLQAIISYVPISNPRLDHVVYEMMLGHFLTHDRDALLRTVKEWPREIYNISAVIIAVRAELDKAASTSSTISSSGSSTILMECLAELYTANRQPGKALPFYLRLRRPNVFDLIKENNLFTDVQDQVLLLVEFDHELMERRKAEGWVTTGREIQSEAIQLLVNNSHSIPITRVVQQLEQKPYYLFLYLDALLHKDPQYVTGFADRQVKLYAEFATNRLIDFLRASTSYNLEMAYKVCQEQDLVPEMVFLLGRMGNNKKALMLIIERLGDVQRAIEFAKEQSDDDLWEDLLKYSETRPAFIRGLLENVGVEISPIRLIRRIKNGLEIPGLKEALIKILQDFHLQISLLEGCQTILNGDSSDLSKDLHKGQSGGWFLTRMYILSLLSMHKSDMSALQLVHHVKFVQRHYIRHPSH